MGQYDVDNKDVSLTLTLTLTQGTLTFGCSSCGTRQPWPISPTQKHTSPFRDHHGCHIMCLETQWQRCAFAVTTVAGPRPVFLPWKVRAALCFYHGQLGPEAQKNRSLVDDVTFYFYVCTEEQTLSDCRACAPPRTSFIVFSPSSPTSRSPAKQGAEHHIATTGPPFYAAPPLMSTSSARMLNWSMACQPLWVPWDCIPNTTSP